MHKNHIFFHINGGILDFQFLGSEKPIMSKTQVSLSLKYNVTVFSRYDNVTKHVTSCSEC